MQINTTYPWFFHTLVLERKRQFFPDCRYLIRKKCSVNLIYSLHVPVGDLEKLCTVLCRRLPSVVEVYRAKYSRGKDSIGSTVSQSVALHRHTMLPSPRDKCEHWCP